jgi:hypothetical protein
MSSLGARFADKRKQSQPVSEPIVAYCKAHRAELSVQPREAAQLLRGITLALTHPSLVETPASSKRIVELFLHGAGAR